MKLYIDGNLQYVNSCDSDQFGQSIYLGCDNRFTCDYYSNPAVITIKQFHFFQKELPIKYYFNESIKDQS